MARIASTTRQRTRDFGTCLSFNGSTGKVTSTYKPFTGSKTFMGWALRTNNSTNDTLIGGDSGGSNAIIRLNANTNTLGFWANSGSSNITWANAIPTGQWFHWALTYNLVNTSLYVNGQLISTQAFSTGWGATTENFKVGSWNSADTDPFIGLQDEIMVFASILTATQISNIYNNGSDSTATPALYWKFDEGSGTTATDSIGSNTGTITGATYSGDVVMKPRQITRGFSTCLFFNGGTDKVALNIATSITGTCTITVWFKRISTTAGGSATRSVQVLTHSTGTQKIFLRPPVNGNVVFVRATNGGSTASFDVGYKDYMDDKWNFLAIQRTSDGSIMSSLNGGLLIDSGVDLTGTMIFDSIGYDYGAPGGAINKQDDERVFSSILTQTQITNLYYGIEPGIVPDILWYKFNEGSGTIANDSSSSLNIGTITGATYSTDVFMIPRTLIT